MTLRFTKPNQLSDLLGLPAFVDQDLATARFVLELAEELVAAELEQTLYAVVEDTVTVGSDGSKVILLPQLPVREVTLVREVGAEGPVTLEAVNWAAALGRRGILRRIDGGIWARDGALEVTYSHGYNVDEDGEELPSWPYPFPGGIRAVMLTAASRGFANPLAARQASIGRSTYTFADVGLYLGASDKLALDRFRAGDHRGAG